MAFRLQAVLNLLTTLDADTNNEGYQGKLVIDDYTSSTDKQEGLLSVDVPTITTSQQVSFGSISHASTMLLIVKEGQIGVQLNSNTAPTIPVVSLAADVTGDPISSFAKLDQPGIVFWRGKISALYLSNTDPTVTIRVYVLLLGEAA